MLDELLKAAQTEVDNHSIYVCGDQDSVTLEEVPVRGGGGR